MAYETASNGSRCATTWKKMAEPTASASRIAPNRTRRRSGRGQAGPHPDHEPTERPDAGHRTVSRRHRGREAGARGDVGDIDRGSGPDRRGPRRAACPRSDPGSGARSGWTESPVAGSLERLDERIRPASRKRLPVSPSMAADTNPGAASADDDSATASGKRSGMWAPTSWSNRRMTIRRAAFSSDAASEVLRLARSSSPVRTMTLAVSISASRRTRAWRASPTTRSTPIAAGRRPPRPSDRWRRHPRRARGARRSSGGRDGLRHTR